MISRIQGTTIDRAADHLIVDVQGVGYQVFVPPSAIAEAKLDSEVTLFTNLIVREDSMTLYGFTDAHQQRLFGTLIGVSGVGPKVALAMLSQMTADDLAFAIASGNAAALARTPGVGQKLASRVVLELKGKLTSATTPANVPGVESEEVIAALASLGYSQAEAADAVARADFPPDAPIEEKVRLALSHFAKARLAE
jgi:Holliday junction DNA helicase RuvA